jgi:hypothetical protein
MEVPFGALTFFYFCFSLFKKCKIDEESGTSFIVISDCIWKITCQGRHVDPPFTREIQSCRNAANGI